MTDPQQHWEQVHTSKSVDDVSWWQPPQLVWLDLIDDLGQPGPGSVVDVGCGSSTLVDALVARQGMHVIGVDLAPAALARLRQRLPSHADVELLAADVRTLRLPTPVDLWHDRAVFHFLTEEADREAYRAAMRASTKPGGVCIVATFAADGPTSCSGLPVERYDPAGLAAALELPAAAVIRSERRIHVTPWGAEQPFTVLVARLG
jgi:SAM-dependent methyltransferase